MRILLTGLSSLLLFACGSEDPYLGDGASAQPNGPEESGQSGQEPSADATSPAPQSASERERAEREARRDLSPSCSGQQSHPVAFTGEEARDRITIQVEREDCPEAAALVTIRSADDALLVAYAFPLKALALTQPPSRENLHDLLSSFTESVTRRPAGELPPLEEATREGPDNPSPIHLQATPEIYERARQRGGNVICFPVHYENFQCVWHDAEHGASLVLYYSGP